MTADEAIAIITGAQVVVTNRDSDKFVEAVNRAILALDGERKQRIPQLRVGIGDIVYSIIDNQIVPMEIQYIYISSKNRVRYHAAEAVLKKNFRESSFGRDVFVSKEAAERKLKQIKEE